MNLENERLPTELGWTTPSPAITGAELKQFQALVVANTKYQPDIMGP
jgi:hypothetical protein